MKKKISKKNLIIACTVLLIGFFFQYTSGLPEERNANIVSIYDGDTIRAKIDGIPGVSKIRIRNIDCFERNSEMAQKQVRRQMERFSLDSAEEVYKRGDAAKAFIEDILNNAKKVTVKIEPNDLRDKYHRVLAEIFADGVNVGEALLKTNYCFPYLDPRKHHYKTH